MDDDEPSIKRRKFEDITVSLGERFQAVLSCLDLPKSRFDMADDEPSIKRCKVEDIAESLEERLQAVLSCAVCLELPKSHVYQCRFGHLMCLQCFNHLLADAQLRIVPVAACPSCRTPIGRDLCSRNRAVENAAAEMPVTCGKCQEKFPRNISKQHDEQCLEKDSTCCYYRIGCPWSGPLRKKSEHEKRCAQPNKTGAEIRDAIPAEFQTHNPFMDILGLLSLDKVSYNDLQLLGPYHTEEHCIRFETFHFCALGFEWEIRAHINNNEVNPTLSSERALSYQLILKESVDGQLDVRYAIVNSPAAVQMKLRPQIEHFVFSDANPKSHHARLPVVDTLECYRLLSGRIHFRILMFMDGSKRPAPDVPTRPAPIPFP